MADSYDVVVIGGGPGGYVCAIRAAQLGMKVACVEKRSTLGGTCLNVGCIPSKALLHASELYAHTRPEMNAMGIKTDGVKLDLKGMMAHKDKSVEELTKGIAHLFKKNKIQSITGTATIPEAGKVEVSNDDGKSQTLEAKHIVIATGSEPADLPGIEIDEERIISSTGALSLNEVPERLLVVGAGYIGLEMGSVWMRLGAEVTVVEFLDRITPGMDGEVAKQFQRLLKRQGMDFKLKTKVSGVDLAKNAINVTIEPADGGDSETIETDVVLVAVGRRPYTDGLGLEDVGVEMEKGRIVTGRDFKSSVDGIYAIGDVIAGPMLAHKAMDEGVAVAEIIAGQAGHINYASIPAVVYTFPEVAAVGKTEEELKEDGIEYSVGKFPFLAVPRAKINKQTDGFIKILADKESDRVLGIHMIGPDAGNMIAEAAMAMEFGATAEDIALICHAHPTLPEGMKEAALAVSGRAIHI